MAQEFKTDKKYIVDLNILNSHNADGCASCNRKFNLGDTVVMAVGGWADNYAKLVHESEAVFDKKTGAYYDRVFFRSMREKQH